MSKTVAVVLAFLSLMLFPTASKAQLLPSGNVYAGVAYADSVDVVNRLTEIAKARGIPTAKLRGILRADHRGHGQNQRRQN